MKQIITLTFLLFASVHTFAAGGEIAQPDGYRDRPYKAPTPSTIPGGTVLDFSDDVAELIQGTDIVLVNVSPITLGPPAKTGKRIWIPKRGKTYQQIVGSHWLPNVGLVILNAGMDTYFQNNLARLTQGDKSRPVMFYCTADCWMSWNASKRAIEEYGYTQVYWYPTGIDGWKADGRALVNATPVPFN